MAKTLVSAAPGSLGPDLKSGDYTGKLFVIEPLEVEKDIKTVHGLSDAIRANVWVLLGKDNTEEFIDTLLFPKVLQGQLKRSIGSIVVGRLKSDTESQKKGQSAPWVLTEATPGDLKKASDFWTKKSLSSATDDGDEEAGEEDGDAF